MAVLTGRRKACSPSSAMPSRASIATTMTPPWVTASSVLPAWSPARRASRARTRRSKSFQLSPPGENGPRSDRRPGRTRRSERRARCGACRRPRLAAVRVGRGLPRCRAAAPRPAGRRSAMRGSQGCTAAARRPAASPVARRDVLGQPLGLHVTPSGARPRGNDRSPPACAGRMLGRLRGGPAAGRIAPTLALRAGLLGRRLLHRGRLAGGRGLRRRPWRPSPACAPLAWRRAGPCRRRRWRRVRRAP